ncbi:hypothetical protein [Streptomyces sp. NPDC001068]|uniref:hypothetical protein n=1 Tax=Streptomyces sp. NPDC001068 TaxID=3364544 RepID=UPI003674A58C
MLACILLTAAAVIGAPWWAARKVWVLSQARNDFGVPTKTGNLPAALSMGALVMGSVVALAALAWTIWAVAH